MSFGRRPPGALVRPRRPGPTIQDAKPQVRRGGLVRAAVAAVLAFTGAAALTVAFAFVLSPGGEASATGVFAYALVGAGPVVLAHNLLGLAIADVILRRFKVSRRAAYFVACGLAPPALLATLMTASGHPPDTWMWLLILPSGLIGGWVLAAHRVTSA